MQSSQGLLIVEDNLSSAFLFEQWLQILNEEITVARSGEEALRALNGPTCPLVILLDMHLPDLTGMQILAEIRRRQLRVKVVVITSDLSPSLAVEAMKQGAHDYLVKPVDDNRLQVSVGNALKAARLEHLASDIMGGSRQPPLAGFIGESPAMQALYRQIRLAAMSDAPVFIGGESGTGKELCAQAIHGLSHRHTRRMVSVNCAAMPSDLAESQLFGHVKGAFTGAVQNRVGLAEEAHGGTLFLDEVTELSLDVQSKLLRFLQTGEITPVGTSSSRRLDCRLVCATNLDIHEQVRKGLFREDLFYRLHVIPLKVPPLRERGDDIGSLAKAFLARYTTEERKVFRGFTPAALDALHQHPWPGNVRELQNLVRYAVIMHDGELLDESMLPLKSLERSAPSSQPKPAESIDAPEPIRPLWLVEKQAIMAALAACDGQITQAAALLEVAPSTIYRKLKLYDIGT
jgi:two-component system, repressor protein LuxO